MAEKNRNDLLGLAYSDDGSPFILVTGKASMNNTEVVDGASPAIAAPWPPAAPTQSARYVMMVVS